MHPSRATAELRKLLEETSSAEVRRDGARHDSWKARVEAVMAASLASESATLKRFRELRYHIGISTGAPGEDDENARYFAAQVDRAAGLIEAAIYELDLTYGAESPGDTDDSEDAPIFVVHGRDDARKYELLRVLDRTTDRDVIVLHEQANRGATLLEKFERHAATAGFAVVLLTGDDEGRLRGDGTLSLRARQNVILELGVFIGRLGRSHVAVLIGPEVERPSDLDGLVYITLNGGTWKLALMGELEAAGIYVNRARIP